MKSRFSTFNDGVLFICKPESDHSSFNAVKNPTKKKELEKILKLNYNEMYRREQDLIEDMLYSIIDLDKDRDRSEMYLYLEEVRKLS